jgi:hypothetical protein
VQPAPAVDDFNSYLDDLRSKAEPIEVEAVDPEDQKENPGTSTAPGEENNRCLSEKTETKGEPVQPGCPDPQGDQESHGKSCGDQ